MSNLLSFPRNSGVGLCLIIDHFFYFYKIFFLIYVVRFYQRSWLGYSLVFLFGHTRSEWFYRHNTPKICFNIFYLVFFSIVDPYEPKFSGRRSFLLKRTPVSNVKSATHIKNMRLGKTTLFRKVISNFEIEEKAFFISLYFHFYFSFLYNT